MELPGAAPRAPRGPGVAALRSAAAAYARAGQRLRVIARRVAGAARGAGIRGVWRLAAPSQRSRLQAEKLAAFHYSLGAAVVPNSAAAAHFWSRTFLGPAACQIIMGLVTIMFQRKIKEACAKALPLLH